MRKVTTLLFQNHFTNKKNSFRSAQNPRKPMKTSAAGKICGTVAEF
ncbi:MAG: hypothetical protein HUK12_08630 [Muribaculaceae bacterium]|nr:hypothetical protein [Muribaculaceae bacterium]